MVDRIDSPPRLTSLADYAYERLESEIIGGDLLPGELLTEGKLSERLGISRTPVREAIRRLEQEQLVTEHGKGILVRGITEADVAEIFEIRRTLEVYATEQCCEKITPEGVERLRQSLDMLRYFSENGGNAAKLQSYDNAFHEEIYAGSGNRTLGEFLSLLHRKLRRYRAASVADNGRAAEMYAEHASIFAAITEGNRKEAGALALRHINNAAAHILPEIAFGNLYVADESENEGK